MMKYLKATITADLKAASDAIRACGEFSIANPSVPVSRNPFSGAADVAMRKATGSKNGEWICRCGRLNPYITEDLRTECCGMRTVNVRKRVAPSPIEKLELKIEELNNRLGIARERRPRSQRVQSVAEIRIEGEITRTKRELAILKMEAAR